MDGPARKRGWKAIYKARARAILNGLPIGSVRDEDAIAFLSELIEMHPESEAKVGAGVARFEIRPSDINPGQRTFWLARVDGTETDFSYLKCLSPPTPLHDFKAACRSAVVDRVLGFKNEAFAGVSFLPCAVTGEVVGPDTSHIDHAPPWTFDRIALAFAGGRDGDELGRMVRPTTDGECRTVFADPATAAEFLAFHDERANLRVVSIEVNLSVLARRAAKQWTRYLTDTTPPRDRHVRFGRHRGKTLGQVADEAPDYLRWLERSGAVSGLTLAAVRTLLDELDNRHEQDGPDPAP